MAESTKPQLQMLPSHLECLNDRKSKLQSLNKNVHYEVFYMAYFFLENKIDFQRWL